MYIEICAGMHDIMYAGMCAIAAQSQQGPWNVRTAYFFCSDQRVDMCIDVCIDMCIGMCVDICVDMCIDMYPGMCIATSFARFSEISIVVPWLVCPPTFSPNGGCSGSFSSSSRLQTIKTWAEALQILLVCGQVCRCACRRICSHVYRHVYIHVLI